MSTMYQLILVGPCQGLTNDSTEVDNLSLSDDKCIADLVSLDADDFNDENISASERARILLEQLEKEGQSLEEALRDNLGSNDGYGVFPDITVIPPVPEAEIFSNVTSASLSVDAEALLRDLENIILPESTPPQSPPQQTNLTEIDQLIYLRSLSLPDPGSDEYLPPTPTSSVSMLGSPVASPYGSPVMLSPQHAPLTPASISSPMYAPSTPASSPYPASTTSWDEDSNTSDPDWSVDSPSPPAKTSRQATQRPKPYARTTPRTKQPADRKERKKLQNKNAATRYRQKKKAEEDELLIEEDELGKTNKELSSKVNDLTNEIRIIKNLLRDQCKRLGIMQHSIQQA